MSRSSTNAVEGKNPRLNPLFNTKEAAAHVGLSEDTIRRACQRRQLAHTRMGDPTGNGKLLIRFKDLERWINSQTHFVSSLDC